jgi:hypothetical protein
LRTYYPQLITEGARMASNEDLGDLTPDQLRHLADGCREAAKSSTYPAIVATLLGLAKRYEEQAAERPVFPEHGEPGSGSR